MVASTESQRPDDGRWSDKLLPLLGITLVTGGLILLGWFAYLWFTPGEAPYQYQLIKEGEAKQFPELELEHWPDLMISKYEIRTTGIDKPLAQAYFGRRGQGYPVMLNWSNHTAEALIGLDRKPSELTTLAEVIGKHATPESVILAWWDTSRQIQLLTGRNTLFKTPLYEPLIVPSLWQENQKAILNYEQQMVTEKASETEREQFKQFSEALLLPPEEGVKRLRALVKPEQEALLVIHVTDLYKIGLMYPEKFGVAYKNFPMTGNIHGMINHMKVQLKEHGYTTYTPQSITDNDIRVFFLTDEKSTQTLLAHMLPFTGRDPPTELKVAQLVYQQGGYWVYKLP